MSNKTFAYLFLWLLLAWSSVGSALSDTLPSFRQVQAAHRPSVAWLVDRNGEPLDTLNLDPECAVCPGYHCAHCPLPCATRCWCPRTNAFTSTAASTGAPLSVPPGKTWCTTPIAAPPPSPCSWPACSTRRWRGHPADAAYTQKWDQIKAARDLEKTWSKAEILEAYLNKVNFRGQLSGINAAAEGLFNTTPLTLNKAEASIFAALLRGPNARPAVVAERACGVAHQLSAPRPLCATYALAYTRLVAKPHLIWPISSHPTSHVCFCLPPANGCRSAWMPACSAWRWKPCKAASRHSRHQCRRRSVDRLNNKTGEIRAYVGSSATASSTQAPDHAATPQAAGATLQPFLYGLAIEQRVLTAAQFLDDAALGVNSDAPQRVVAGR